MLRVSSITRTIIPSSKGHTNSRHGLELTCVEIGGILSVLRAPRVDARETKHVAHERYSHSCLFLPFEHGFETYT